ncbi:signal recognition particle protein [archaeon]|nr:signal recognition particle protein [archaeon]|tara:strand:+ start:3069 stop:4418 length:1350 start_codon:yes stop_codon:yes gene_type:complete
MLEKLSTSLKGTLSKVAKSIFLDKNLIEELVKELQRSLLASDVNVSLVFELSEKIKTRALKEKPPKTVSPKEHIIKIVYEELVNLFGKKSYELKIEKKKPFKIMFVGLYGSGKTTSISKLANYYTKKNYKVATLGLDIHRPAAPEQLKQLSDQINIPSFISKEKDSIKIYKEFEKEFSQYDILLIDTAGRDALSDDLIKELSSLNKKIKPDETLLVMSADIGQTALEQAKKFHETCNVTGVIATKMDGTAKGGGALTGAAATKAPIKFIGTGEKINDLETFDPTGFVSRLLGMGDLKTLLEKVEDAMSEEEAKDLGKKFLKGDFNLLDLYEQMEAMSKMGPISKVTELIPGFSQLKLPKDVLQVQEGKLKKWKFILDSLTQEELENPEIITSSRIQRIASGSGTTTREIRELLKQYKQSKKVMKLMKGKEPNMEKLMKKFKGKLPKGFT